MDHAYALPPATAALEQLNASFAGCSLQESQSSRVSTLPLASVSSSASSSSVTVYTPFHELRPYTMTALAALKDGELKYENIFPHLPVREDAHLITNRRKEVPRQLGEIITVKAFINGKPCVRGYDSGTPPFGNCTTVVIGVSDEQGRPSKYIDFKIFSTGIQSTGNLRPEHTTEAWGYIKEYMCAMEDVCTVPVEALELDTLKFHLINISFNLHFKVNRANIKDCLHRYQNFQVDWESGIHTNGVNIKYPLPPLPKKDDSAAAAATTSPAADSPAGRRTRKPGARASSKKIRCISFIVFATGKVIMSGDDLATMAPVYSLFNETVLRHRDTIEMKLLPRE